MENPEEVLQSLDEFAKLKPKDIPRELEDYLSYVAKTGDPVYQWSIVKCLFREKLLNVITDFYETSPTIDLPPCPNVDPFNYETMKNSLIERLESFPSAPFTVQRLCELLTTPRKEYSRADKFMRAIEKNILVVSTREPGNVRRSDSNGQSELLMNGVMDGRGIELGEAIETVSSEGVNMMHANENEVNVTENENVVTVECGGMEEIDMEEQSDNMEATTTNAWGKDQTDNSSQKEENGNVEKVEEKVEGDDKSKDNPDSLEGNNVDSIESRDNSELPAAEDNVESAEAVPENPNSDSEIGLEENKQEVGLEENKQEVELEENKQEVGLEENKQEVDSTESSSHIQSNTSIADEKTPKESEESSENNPTDTDVSEEKSVSEEKIPVPSVKESVDSSSADEDVSNSISSTETVAVVESSNDETAAKNEPIQTPSLVVPNASEPVPDVIELESDSSSSDATSSEACTKDDETSIVVDSAEVTDTTSAVSTSEVESVEEVSSTKLLTDEEISETKQEDSEQAAMQDVVCEQVEAMEVDEAVSSELLSADGEEPMDQSEQPTTEQLES